MSSDGVPGAICPIPLSEYPEIVLAHGGGGALTHRLIEQMIVPTFDNPLLDRQLDAACIDPIGARLAFTTDSYVVKPHFFPGGDIGALAVNGTVNDLLMCGARPLYLSVGLILEEGFATADLWRVLLSMKAAADDAGVQLVTGDTKVVDRGHGDGIFINTSGVGAIAAGRNITPGAVRPGDVVIVSGDIARHGMAVMAAREALEFESPIESDTAALQRPVLALLDAGIDVHCLRDPTRGGVATTLIEIAEAAGVDITIDDAAVPLADDVRGACEILGLDPLYVANEGRFIAFVPAGEQARTLALLHGDPLCAEAVVLGRVGMGHGSVCAATPIGGQRVLDRLSGEQLPRIC